MAMAPTPPPLASSGDAQPPRHLVDVVLIGDVKDLSSWSTALTGYNVVAVPTGSEEIRGDLSIAGMEVHSIADAKRALPYAHSDLKALARSYGLLHCRRKYVCFLDADCCCYGGAAGGAMDQHLANISSPSTPFFFNTLYDPFRPGVDFVRGYPFSLRSGVPTAVSHGLVTPAERIADAVLTIPRGVHFAMSAANVCFDRQLIGAAMAVPNAAPILTGLLVKVVCDHLGYGVKSGLPHLQGREQDEEALQDALLRFFASLRLPASASTAEDCVAAVAKQLKSTAAQLGGSVSSAADSMEPWIQAWKKNAS